MTDYAREFESVKDDPFVRAEDKMELDKLASLQKDIAIAGSAEDFIRHPFFKLFENHVNDIILDSKGKMSELLKQPDVTLDKLKAYQAGIDMMIELKQWWNTFVIKGRIARQAIEIYEQDTAALNDRVQEAVDNQNIES